MKGVLARRGARMFGLALAALAIVVPSAAAKPHHGHGRYVDLQLLAVNDFHGNLEATPTLTTAIGPPLPGSTSNQTTPSGGIEYLASHLREARRGHRHSLTVSAGDLIGASPLLSGLFHDEPTIEAFNDLGLSLNTVGNHEFDEGKDELLRMQNGGCHPTDGCQDKTGFGGAEFKFLSANVVVKATGRTLFPAYVIKKVGGVRVAFVGMTLEGTPDIVSPSGVAGLEFRDEADTVRDLMPQLRRRHVKAIVILLHQGGFQTQAKAWEYDTCKGLDGEVLDVVKRLPEQVDVVVSGHTHAAYNCPDVFGKRVTSASSFGRLYTELDLTLDRRTKDIVADTAENHIVTRDVDKADDMTSLLDHYLAFEEPLAKRPIGRIAADIPEAYDNTGESPAGNLIADSQLAATKDAGTGNAVAAFMNPGGVRGDAGFVYAPDGVVTYGEAFDVQPFGNTLVTLTYTGAQLYEVLKQQWCGRTGNPVILQPSGTIHYTYSASVAAAITKQPCDDRNPITSLTIGGQAVSPTASYRITVNNFLADGGDTFPGLRAGIDRLGGAVDLDALEAYMKPSLAPGAPAVQPPATDRIDVTG